MRTASSIGWPSTLPARVVRRLAERNVTALFYSHKIVPTEKHAPNDISFAELEFILKTAQVAGVRVCGLDELETHCDW